MRLLLIVLAAFCSASLASAKGLDDLSNSNPETAEGEGEAAPAEGEGEGEGEGAKDKPTKGESAAKQPQGALSKMLSQNFSIAPGFARVIASKSSGDWESNGMTDVTAAYKLSNLSKIMSLHGTFRYAPIAVSGTEDEHSYRGIWEAYMFGARVAYQVSQTLTALGSAELGYVASHLTPVDGLDPVKKHEAGGATFAVGGGADWTIGEKGGFTGGPRLFAGFGSFTIIQIGGALSFLF